MPPLTWTPATLDSRTGRRRRLVRRRVRPVPLPPPSAPTVGPRSPQGATRTLWDAHEDYDG